MSDANRKKSAFSVFGRPVSLVTPANQRCNSPACQYPHCLIFLSFSALLHVHPDKSLKCHGFKDHED